MNTLNPYYTNRRPEVARFLPSNLSSPRVLEIGCGAGVFRSNFASPQEYWGVEMSADAAALASKCLEKVLVGTYREVCAKLPDNYFDCVVCADVIEHMDDEVWFLQHIKTKMSSNSVLVGSIPNVRYVSNLARLLIQRDWRYVDVGILDRTHQRFFTQKSLQRILQETGWTIEAMHGINPVNVRQASVGQVLLSAGLLALTSVLGSDSRFFQFGFRVRANNQ